MCFISERLIQKPETDCIESFRWVGIKRGNGMAEWRKRNGGIGDKTRNGGIEDKTRNGSNGGIGIKRGMGPMAE